MSGGESLPFLNKKIHYEERINYIFMCVHNLNIFVCMYVRMCVCVCVCVFGGWVRTLASMGV